MNGWRHTTVENTDVLALRAAIRFALPDMEWRRHGIGVIQAYLREGEDHEVRVHIWHPAIRLPGIVGNGDVHNHRFLMRSTVLSGSITHIECHVEDDPKGRFALRDVVHARKDAGFRYKELTRRANFFSYSGKIHQGQSYEFEQGAFHKTTMDGLVITVITKLNQTDTMALVASPWDLEPVHAFKPGDDFDESSFVDMTYDALK